MLTRKNSAIDSGAAGEDDKMVAARWAARYTTEAKVSCVSFAGRTILASKSFVLAAEAGDENDSDMKLVTVIESKPDTINTYVVTDYEDTDEGLVEFDSREAEGQNPEAVLEQNVQETYGSLMLVAGAQEAHEFLTWYNQNKDLPVYAEEYEAYKAEQVANDMEEDTQSFERWMHDQFDADQYFQRQQADTEQVATEMGLEASVTATVEGETPEMTPVSADQVADTAPETIIEPIGRPQEPKAAELSHTADEPVLSTKRIALFDTTVKPQSPYGVRTQATKKVKAGNILNARTSHKGMLDTGFEFQL